ncbi:preprotein translocase subunit SecG [Candidatus Peregrinibacteria bacterium]|nr:preprotein translocase subunit SecG [Candidatus Peregrinibacteria bacterium]MBI5732472.1 preprotein translocase subunit SecG [Candidatus Jorgensenbacteria bacterium]
MSILGIAQIIISAVLITLILIQERSSGLSNVLGGAGGTPYQTRRGLEKTIFWATIVSGIIFAGLAIWNLLSQ